MRKFIFAAAVLAAGSLLAAEVSVAHHSFAMFDHDKTITVSGTVRKWEWTNPHTWLTLDVPGPQGEIVEWKIEGLSPNILSRQGWSSNSIHTGDRVTVEVNPLRGGGPGGALVKVTLPDGKVLGRGGVSQYGVSP